MSASGNVATSDVTMQRPVGTTDEQWSEIRTWARGHMVVTVAAELGAIEHAPWCVELESSFGCDGRVCYQADYSRTVKCTGDSPRRDERGGLQHHVVNVYPTRIIDPDVRHGEITDADLHVLAIHVGLEDWDPTAWFDATLPQARQLIARLSEAVAMCEADADALARTVGGEVSR